MVTPWCCSDHERLCVAPSPPWVHGRLCSMQVQKRHLSTTDKGLSLAPAETGSEAQETERSARHGFAASLPASHHRLPSASDRSQPLSDPAKRSSPRSALLRTTAAWGLLCTGAKSSSLTWARQVPLLSPTAEGFILKHTVFAC